MNFVHEPYEPGRTVAAVATPPGEGGVAIIRISGDRALDVADKVFSGKVHSYVSHTAHYGKVVGVCGGAIDDVLLLVMRAPRSYTGEDTVEIHCHGGALITRRVFSTVLSAGALAARPGEFTFKAFMNDKIDLAQAEAVQELIAAKNDHAVDAAKNLLQGRLSGKISAFQKRLTLIAAMLEAWVDFPEDDLEFAASDEVCRDLTAICDEMAELAATFHDGKIVHDGISVCFVGAPNVGKSSLMNALLDKERAIVSPVSGTTRDLIEDQMYLSGLNLRLIDTAGLRESEDAIELEGMRRSHAAMAEADLILFVLDATRQLTPYEQALFTGAPQRRSIAVWNKIDLQHDLPLPELSLFHAVAVSAKTREGLKQLQGAIDTIIWAGGPPSKEELLITNIRHKTALEAACSACRSAAAGLAAGASPELLSDDMRYALIQLGTIIGTDISDDILTAIFSTFCIGK